MSRNLRKAAVVPRTAKRVKALDLIIEAKDPHGRGSVMVLCRSRGEAIETIAKLGREGYRDISVSDADGSIIPKEQLTDSH